MNTLHIFKNRKMLMIQLIFILVIVVFFTIPLGGCKTSQKSEMESRIEFLQSEINRHDHLYYVLAKPEISDAEYDELYNELLKLESENPHLDFSNSPTHRVGSVNPENPSQIRHKTSMLSLDKFYTFDKIYDFDERTKKALNVKKIQYVVEPKIDGVAISLIYENGKLQKAVTRGNGIYGEDVTIAVKTIKTIPLEIPEKNIERLDVRGEIFLPKEKFTEWNKNAKSNNLPEFQNCRNAAAGALKCANPQDVALRGLDCVIYASGSPESLPVATHSEMLMKFTDWRFKIIPWQRVCESPQDVISAIQELQKKKYKFPFEIDGTVIKINRISHYEKCGNSSKSPNWAFAFKFPNKREKTVLEKIILQVGSSGFITPVAKVKPVNISGSTISNVTLHNLGEIIARDLRVGDKVWIAKAGEIIPNIEIIAYEDRTGNETKFELPTKCPSCNSPLANIDKPTKIQCRNFTNCPAQAVSRLLRFVSRDALCIDAIGAVNAKAIIKSGIISSPLDLFFVDEKELSKVKVGNRTIGKIRAEAILKSCQNARQKPLQNWLYALNIPGIGKTNAKVIATLHKSFDEIPDSIILRKCIETNKEIESIRPEIAKKILDFFKTKTGAEYLRKMRLIRSQI